MRKTVFADDEIYHVFNRAVERQPVKRRKPSGGGSACTPPAGGLRGKRVKSAFRRFMTIPDRQLGKW